MSIPLDQHFWWLSLQFCCFNVIKSPFLLDKSHEITFFKTILLVMSCFITIWNHINPYKPRNPHDAGSKPRCLGACQRDQLPERDSTSKNCDLTSQICDLWGFPIGIDWRSQRECNGILFFKPSAIRWQLVKMEPPGSRPMWVWHGVVGLLLAKLNVCSCEKIYAYLRIY